jgi:hypothetical protein
MGGGEILRFQWAERAIAAACLQLLWLLGLLGLLGRFDSALEAPGPCPGPADINTV